MQRPGFVARTQEVKYSTPRHQLGFSAFGGGGAKGGVSQIPGPPPYTHRTPAWKGGGALCPLCARNFGGGRPSGAASRSPGTIGPEGGRPPGLRSNSPFHPTFARAEPGAQGGGISKPGIQGWGEIQALLRQSLLPSQGLSVRNCFAPPFSRCIFPFACRSWLWRSLQFANWGGGVVANRGRPLPCKPEGSLRCTRRQAGQARPGWAPTPWPLPPGHPRLLT